MSPCSRSAGVSAISTAIVLTSSPCETTACAVGSVPSPPPQPARTAKATARSALDEGPALEAEEELLPLEAAGVADEATARADDPVARNHDRHRVSVQRSADRPRGLRLPDTRGEPAIGVHLAVWDTLELGENDLLECGHRAQVDREVEVLPAALEVFVELAPSFVQGPRRAEHAHAVQTRKALDLGVWIGVEGDLTKATPGGGDEERPDRGVGQVV